jgi:hypothetical protein
MTPPAGPPDDEKEPGSGRFLAFWTTLPGILTSVAALITAIVALATLVHSWQGGSQTASPDEAPAATTSSTMSTAASSGITRQGRTGMSREVSFALRRGDAADLEQGMISFSANDDVIFGPESTPYLYASGTASLAPVQAAPSKPTCRQALSARRDTFEDPEPLGALDLRFD